MQDYDYTGFNVLSLSLNIQTEGYSNNLPTSGFSEQRVKGKFHPKTNANYPKTVHIELSNDTSFISIGWSTAKLWPEVLSHLPAMEVKQRHSQTAGHDVTNKQCSCVCDVQCVPYSIDNTCRACLCFLQLHVSHFSSIMACFVCLICLLYELKFSRWFYFREFRESNPRENFHFNLCLFIVMTTSAKSRN